MPRVLYRVEKTTQKPLTGGLCAIWARMTAAMMDDLFGEMTESQDAQVPATQQQRHPRRTTVGAVSSPVRPRATVTVKQQPPSPPISDEETERLRVSMEKNLAINRKRAAFAPPPPPPPADDEGGEEEEEERGDDQCHRGPARGSTILGDEAMAAEADGEEEEERVIVSHPYYDEVDARLGPVDAVKDKWCYMCEVMAYFESEETYPPPIKNLFAKARKYNYQYQDKVEVCVRVKTLYDETIKVPKRTARRLC